MKRAKMTVTFDIRVQASDRRCEIVATCNVCGHEIAVPDDRSIELRDMVIEHAQRVHDGEARCYEEGFELGLEDEKPLFITIQSVDESIPLIRRSVAENWSIGVEVTYIWSRREWQAVMWSQHDLNSEFRARGTHLADAVRECVSRARGLDIVFIEPSCSVQLEGTLYVRTAPLFIWYNEEDRACGDIPDNWRTELYRVAAAFNGKVLYDDDD